jgi:hypothetical protein
LMMELDHAFWLLFVFLPRPARIGDAACHTQSRPDELANWNPLA